MVQINAGIALRYGIDNCVGQVVKVIRAFDAKGVGLQYFEFGNELFGWWSAPYDYDDFKWDGRDYGVAFSSVRRKVLDRYPDRGLSFGLVVNDDEPGVCHGSHICDWQADILITHAKWDADWLSVHRYFSDYGPEWVNDLQIAGSAEPMLDHVYGVLLQHFDNHDVRLPRIGLTEYNAVFRQTPACGASQQYISFLWQVRLRCHSIVTSLPPHPVPCTSCGRWPS